MHRWGLWLTVLYMGCGAGSGTGPGELLPAGRAELAPRRKPSVLVSDGAGVRAEPAADVVAVDLGFSWREVRLTERGLAWSVPCDLPRGGVLDMALGTPTPPGTTPGATATVEVVREGRVEVLWQEVVDVPGGWIQRRLELPRMRDAELRFSSDGAPVAWSEVAVGTGGGTDPRPDIVLVLVDTLRADRLGCYGNPRPTSPNLDRLAAEGLRFEHALSASTWTLPSTASILSGLLPDQHGVRVGGEALSDAAVTAAERLRAAGYRTVAFTDGGWVHHRWGFGQGFARFDVLPRTGRSADVRLIVDAALEWLDTARQHPYLLVVHTYEVHQPYVDPDGFAEPFLDPAYEGRLDRRVKVASTRPEEYDAADAAWMLGLYDGEIRRADHHLARLLERLRSSPRWDRTAVIVTSDHGEEFLDHGGIEHVMGRVYDANVRVPLLLRLPDGTRRGVVQAPASGVDIAPTLIDLAGLDPDRSLPGRSLLEIADGGWEKRAVAVHGIPALRNLEVDRVRLDQDDDVVVFERFAGLAERYVRRDDPGLRAPQPLEWRVPAARRLQALLAWLGPGEAFVRLGPGEPWPDGVSVRWTGLRPLSADGGPDVPRIAALAAHGGAPVWRPFEDPIPGAGQPRGTAPRLAAEERMIDPATEAALRELGYLP
jgi:hypothetical protein